MIHRQVSIYRGLLLVTLALGALNFVPQRLAGEKFALDAESNVPTWYSSMLLFSIALAAAGMYCTGRARTASGRRPWFWPVFAAGFAWLSLDEVAHIHECLNLHMNLNWAYVYAPFAAAFSGTAAHYLLCELRDRSLSAWVLTGLGLQALGGFGLETLNWVAPLGGLYTLEVLIEETLEMVGSATVLTGLLIGLSRPRPAGQAPDATERPSA